MALDALAAPKGEDEGAGDEKVLILISPREVQEEEQAALRAKEIRI